MKRLLGIQIQLFNIFEPLIDHLSADDRRSMAGSRQHTDVIRLHAKRNNSMFRKVRVLIFFIFFTYFFTSGIKLTSCSARLCPLPTKKLLPLNLLMAANAYIGESDSTMG